jgi:hypothetical protein
LMFRISLRSALASRKSMMRCAVIPFHICASASAGMSSPLGIGAVLMKRRISAGRCWSPGKRDQ